jgi:hypothetical protein
MQPVAEPVNGSSIISGAVPRLLAKVKPLKEAFGHFLI